MSNRRLFFLAAIAGIFSATLPQEARAEWTNSLKPKGQPAASLTLATDGQSDYVIVIPSEPTPQDRKAADELTLWLGKMTGVRFLTVADSQPPRETEISIGKTNRLRDANIPEAKADLAAEGYAIGVEGKRLYLLGGRKRGAINGVVERKLQVPIHITSIHSYTSNNLRFTESLRDAHRASRCCMP